MRITNKSSLPRPLYDAICMENTKYSKGESDVTVTQLIDSPRIRILRNKHWDDIEEDAADILWRFYGQVAHGVISNMPTHNRLIEERLYADVLGWKVGGQLDDYVEIGGQGVITDYKITSKYSVKAPKGRSGMKQIWVDQMILYRALLYINGFNAFSYNIVCILRDAFAHEEKVKTFRHVFVSHQDECRISLDAAVLRHQQAEIGELPICTLEERWTKPSVYAVMQKGRKTALKLHETRESAANQIANTGNKNNYVEFRPGKEVRCENYCSVNKWCDFYQDTVKVKEVKSRLQGGTK